MPSRPSTKVDELPVSFSPRTAQESSKALASSSDQIADAPAHLLSFYATECALKAAVMKEKRVPGWSDLSPEDIDLFQHHDLSKLAKAINAGGEAAKALKACRTRDGLKTVPIHEMHSAWRYGTKLRAQDEANLVQALRDIREWLAARD